MGVVWLACTTAGIQIIVMLLAFTVFSFLPNRNIPPPPSGSKSLLQLVVSQQTSCRLLHAFRALWPCSVLLPGTLSSDGGSLCPCCWHWQIARSMNNITCPTDAETEPGYKLNCTRRGTVGGARDWINSMGNTDIRLCSNYPTSLTQHGLTTMICWLC